MKIGFLGDLHGNIAAGRFMMWSMGQMGIDTVFHVGDFGIYSTNDGMKFASKMNEYAELLGITLIVVPGNHENWRIINELTGDNRLKLASYRSSILIAPRGYRTEIDGVSFVLLGGAPSVDRNWRAEADRKHAEKDKFRANQYWYWEEQITGADVDYVKAGGYADVMIGHDAPHGIQGIDRIIRGNPHGFHIADILYAEEGRILLTEAFSAVAPRFYFHGHYHFPVNEEIRVHNDDGWCHVIGLDCEFNNYSMAVLDTETLRAYSVNHNDLLAQYRKDNFTWPPPRLYEDIDGCLNASWNARVWRDADNPEDLGGYQRGWVSPEHDDSGERRGTSMVKYRMEFNDRLVSALNELELEIVWTTTWRADALAVGTLMGLLHEPQRVLHPMDGFTSFPSIEWKYDAILYEQEHDPSPFIAVDDEWDSKPDYREALESIGGLVISPDPNFGITPKHIAEMREYTASH